MNGALMLTIASLASTRPNSTRPNILFVVLDDCGYTDVGFHGSEISTPVLDNLVATGVELSRYYGWHELQLLQLSIVNSTLEILDLL